MTAITEFLFPAPAQRGAPAIMRWWENRRLHYNAIVGTTGIFSLGVCVLTNMLPPGAHSQLPPLLPILAYAFMANVCYSMGPLCEVLFEKIWDRKVLPAGPTLYRMGLTFSVGLTVLPAFMFGLDWVRRIVFFMVSAAVGN